MSLRQGTTPQCPAEAIVVRRSARRTTTVSAFYEDGQLVVCIPATFTGEQERRWVGEMQRRLHEQSQRRKQSDLDLVKRAEYLATTYLHGVVMPASVRWSSAQRRVWGTCCSETGTIRISRALLSMPQWVLDYVIVHELVHLLEPGHTERFWALVAAYPQSDRARGYLEGYAHRHDTTEYSDAHVPHAVSDVRHA